ncbi:hypothetical protein ACLOJK_004440, partial [Asimina triloba]
MMHCFLVVGSWIWILAVDLPPTRRTPAGSAICPTRQLVATYRGGRPVLPRRDATSSRRHPALVARLGRRCLPSTLAVLAVVQLEKMATAADGFRRRLDLLMGGCRRDSPRCSCGGRQIWVVNDGGTAVDGGEERGCRSLTATKEIFDPIYRAARPSLPIVTCAAHCRLRRCR